MDWRSRFLFIALQLFASYSAIAAGGPFDRVIPSEALLYWGYDGSSDPKDAFPNYQQAMKNWSLLMDDVLEWRVIKGELEAIGNKSGVEEAFTALTGNQSSFALYPLVEGVPVPGIALYAADVKDAQKAERVLNTLFEEIRSILPGVQISKDEYYGYPIQSFSNLPPLPGLDLAYTFKESTLLLSNSKSLLLRVIDRWDEGKGFLADVEIYQKAIAEFPEKRSYTFFANLSEVGKTGDLLLKNLQALQQLDSAEELGEAMPIIEGAIDLLGSFNSYASTRSFDSLGRLVSASNLQMNLAIEDESIRALLNRPPVPFQYAKYLPRKVGTVSSGNILGPKDLWMLVHTYLPKFPPVSQSLDVLQQWEEESGFSLENDFFSWMGDSWCFLRPVMDLESVIATNQGALFLEVNDAEAAQKGIQKLVDLIIKTYQIPIVMGNETYLDTQIYTLTLPLPLLPISPSWCIHEKTLIVTSRPAMIHEMLDIHAGVRSGIDRNRQYSSLKDALNLPANKASFQDNESEFYAFREAIRKVASIPELSRSLPEEFRSLPGFFLERAAYLMNCWQTLRGTVKRTTVHSDQLVVEKVLLYGDLRAVPPIDSIPPSKISLGAKDWIAAAAELSSQQGNVDRALRLYNLLVDFFPQEGAYRSRLASMYKTAGNLQEGLALYDRILEKNPATADLVGRESLLDNSTVEEIQTRVRAITAKTMRIREDASFLGIALGKRNAGDAKTAEGLFQLVAQSPNSASALAAAAEKEMLFSKGESVDGLIAVPFTPNPPAIDGALERDIWDRSSASVIRDASGQNAASVRLLRDESNFYIRMDGSVSPAAKKAQILLCPNRDYTHVFVIAVEKTPENKAIASFTRQVIDPYKITLDTRELTPQNLIPPKFTDFFIGVETAIGKGQISDSNLNLLKDSQNAMPAAWIMNDQEDSLELALPLSLLPTGNKPESPVWLFNLIRTVDIGGQSADLSLGGGNDPLVPFNYAYIRVHQ